MKTKMAAFELKNELTNLTYATRNNTMQCHPPIKNQMNRHLTDEILINELGDEIKNLKRMNLECAMHIQNLLKENEILRNKVNVQKKYKSCTLNHMTIS